MTILVVTGTSTDVGKTAVTAAIAALAPDRVAGRVAVVKPAQTGVAPGEPGDLAEVTRLAGCGDVHEFARYPDPLSPHAAAALAGMPELDQGETAERILELAATRDLVIVEGAGGLLVPFSRDGWTLRDLAFDLDAAVVLVVAAGLGTLNHTALTLEAMDGLELAGLVIGSWPAQLGLAERSNVVDLYRMQPRRFAGALPAGITGMRDFPERVRPWLGPEFGGIFDPRVFVEAVRPDRPGRRRTE